MCHRRIGLSSRGIAYLSRRLTLLAMMTFLHAVSTRQLINASLSSGVSACPKTCFCNALSKIVYCSRRGLAAIPDGISPETLQLNLNGNAFHTAAVGRSNFSRYRELEHLYMSECGVESLEVDTFLDLSNLKWLDLSNNRIKVRHLTY